MNRAAEIGPGTVPWWRDWRGECVAIVASGPSAKTAPVQLLRDRINIIAVNDSWKLVPFADILYGCDLGWWDYYKGVKEFNGLKLTHDATAARVHNLHKVTIANAASNEILTDQPAHLGAGGNGGFQMLNLAVQFGGTGIMLIGVDCDIEHGSHWHGRHPVPLNNPAQTNVTRWRQAFEGSAKPLAKLGIDVVNCSLVSKLTCWPKITIEQALARWQL